MSHFSSPPEHVEAGLATPRWGNETIPPPDKWAEIVRSALVGGSAVGSRAYEEALWALNALEQRSRTTP